MIFWTAFVRSFPFSLSVGSVSRSNRFFSFWTISCSMISTTLRPIGFSVVESSSSSISRRQQSTSAGFEGGWLCPQKFATGSEIQSYKHCGTSVPVRHLHFFVNFARREACSAESRSFLSFSYLWNHSSTSIPFKLLTPLFPINFARHDAINACETEICRKLWVASLLD